MNLSKPPNRLYLANKNGTAEYSTPDWRQIDTPWEQQPIAWRLTDHQRRKSVLREQAATAITHLVREVLVQDPRTCTRPTDVDETKAILAQTDEELRRLADCGVPSAEVNWHVFTDETKRARALARVAIIDGIDVSQSYEVPDHDIYEAWEKGIGKYWQGSNYRISEFTSLSQYRFGTPRTATASNPKLYLVDIEPIYWDTPDWRAGMGT